MAETGEKSHLAKSEVWINGVTALGAGLTAIYAKNPGVLKWIAPGITVLLAVIYALFHTPLAPGDGTVPGWKTKSFWMSLATIVGSAAAALSESDIVGIPAKVIQVAGLIVAMFTAMGYTIWRYNTKRAP